MSATRPHIDGYRVGPERDRWHFAAPAVERLQAAVRELFTPRMTLVLKVRGGPDLPVTISGTLDGGQWTASGEAVDGEIVVPLRPAPDVRGKVFAAELRNGDGLLVGRLRLSEPIALSPGLELAPPPTLGIEFSR